MPLAHKLSENNNVTVECPSGIYNYFHEGIYGKEVKELISKRYAQYCFTSCNGIDLVNGLTFSTDLDITLIRACRKNCNKLVVLADHTKFGMTYYFKTLSIKEIDIIITDQEPEEKWITYCEEKWNNPDLLTSNFCRRETDAAITSIATSVSGNS